MALYETQEAVAKLSDTDPELKEWLEAGNQPIIVTSSLEETANMLAHLPPTVLPDTPTDFALEIPLRDGRLSKARVHKSSRPSSVPAPLVVYIYGGGFVVGEPLHVAASAKSIAEATGAVVVVPSYRLAPKHPFPAAPDDVWDAFTWLAEPTNSVKLGADVSAGLVIGGVSAGGNLAAVTAHRYVADRPQGTAPLTGIILVNAYRLEPELVPEKHKPLWFSREQNYEALIFDGKDLEFLHRQYKPDIRSPQFSPFNAPWPEGLPPVYIQLCGQDPLRDDPLVYERVAREKGVRTRMDVYPGVPHGHGSMYPGLKSALKANVELVKGAGWLLEKEVTDVEARDAYAKAAASLAPQAE